MCQCMIVGDTFVCMQRKIKLQVKQTASSGSYLLPSGQNRQKNSLKDIVKNTLLQTAFSAILPAGNDNRLSPRKAAHLWLSRANEGLVGELIYTLRGKRKIFEKQTPGFSS